MGILVNYALVNGDNMQLYPLHFIGVDFNIYTYIIYYYYFFFIRVLSEQEVDRHLTQIAQRD